MAFNFLIYFLIYQGCQALATLWLQAIHAPITRGYFSYFISNKTPI
tara:strand:- start:114 stop:251 length:138 start_codon:yes stop_codon:yes gene_type:complete